MRIFPLKWAQDKDGSSGEKGGKICGCLREKGFSYTPSLEKSNCLSVNLKNSFVR